MHITWSVGPEFFLGFCLLGLASASSSAALPHVHLRIRLLLSRIHMHSLLKSRAASCPDCTLAMLLEPWPWARRSRSSGSTPPPFSSGCRSHSSVDVIHAGKEPQGAWLHSQSKVSLSPAAAGKGELLVARLLWGFKNLSQKGDTAYSALTRIFTQRLVDFFRVQAMSCHIHVTEQDWVCPKAHQEFLLNPHA
jgi:hypothetical protein